MTFYEAVEADLLKRGPRKILCGPEHCENAELIGIAFNDADVFFKIRCKDDQKVLEAPRSEVNMEAHGKLAGLRIFTGHWEFILI